MQPLGVESRLVEALSDESIDRKVLASRHETMDERMPSQRIVHDDEVEPAPYDRDQQPGMGARGAARDAAAVKFSQTIGSGSTTARDRYPDTYHWDRPPSEDVGIPVQARSWAVARKRKWTEPGDDVPDWCVGAPWPDEQESASSCSGSRTIV